MGTRSLTHIKVDDLNSATLCTLYRQFDGYPSGIGNDIKRAIGKVALVNGYNTDHENGKFANGMGCLASTLIKKLKKKIGNVYIYLPDSTDCWEDFIYTVYAGAEVHGVSKVCLQVCNSRGTQLYNGYLSDFTPKKCVDQVHPAVDSCKQIWFNDLTDLAEPRR